MSLDSPKGTGTLGTTGHTPRDHIGGDVRSTGPEFFCDACDRPILAEGEAIALVIHERDASCGGYPLYFCRDASCQAVLNGGDLALTISNLVRRIAGR